MTRVAITIQRFYRGFRVRKRFKKYGPGYNMLIKEKERYQSRKLSRSIDTYVHSKKIEKERPISSRAKTVNERARFEHHKQLKWNRAKIAREDIDEEGYDDLKLLEQCKELIIACRKNQIEKILILDFVVLRGHTRYQDDKQNTALYYAAKHKSMKMSHLLLEKGANPNDVCSEGNTPFHIACQGNNVAVKYRFTS